eukprot:gene6579-biopygen8948
MAPDRITSHGTEHTFTAHPSGGHHHSAAPFPPSRMRRKAEQSGSLWYLAAGGGGGDWRCLAGRCARARLMDGAAAPSTDGWGRGPIHRWMGPRPHPPMPPQQCIGSSASAAEMKRSAPRASVAQRAQ